MSHPSMLSPSRRNLLAMMGATTSLAACSAAQAPPSNSPSKNNQASIGQPQWTSETSLPFAVQEIYPTAHAGKIHIAGGLLGMDGRVIGVSERHDAWDPKTGSTTQLAPIPSARHHPQLVSHAGKLYLLGGFKTEPNAVNWIMTNDTFIHDDANDTWSALAPAPEAHGESVATVLNGHIHIVGGRRNTKETNLSYGDHTDSTTHMIFDPANNTWAYAAPALTARNSATGASINGLWHVVGGRSLTGGGMDTHEVYDPTEDRWYTAAPVPTGIGAGGNACGILDNKIYVFGGETRTEVHPELCCYDPTTDTWEIVGEMPTPRHGLGGITLNNTVYAVGGAIRPSGNGTSNAIEALHLA